MEGLAASSGCAVTAEAVRENVLVSCWMFHLMVKAHGFTGMQDPAFYFLSVQITNTPKSIYKICSRSVFQKLMPSTTGKLFQECIKISNAEVARKRFLSLTFLVVGLTAVLCTGLCFPFLLECSSQQTFLLPAALRPVT